MRLARVEAQLEVRHCSRPPVATSGHQGCRLVTRPSCLAGTSRGNWVWGIALPCESHRKWEQLCLLFCSHWICFGTDSAVWSYLWSSLCLVSLPIGGSQISRRQAGQPCKVLGSSWNAWQNRGSGNIWTPISRTSCTAVAKQSAWMCLVICIKPSQLPASGSYRAECGLWELDKTLQGERGCCIQIIPAVVGRCWQLFSNLKPIDTIRAKDV